MHLEKKRSRLAHDAVWHDSIFTSNPSGLRTGMRALAVRLADQRASPRRPSRTWWQPFRNTCRDVSCGQSHFIQTRTREWYLLSARTHTHTHTYVRPYTHPLRLYYLSTKPPVKLSHLLTSHAPQALRQVGLRTRTRSHSPCRLFGGTPAPCLGGRDARCAAHAHISRVSRLPAERDHCITIEQRLVRPLRFVQRRRGELLGYRHLPTGLIRIHHLICSSPKSS